MRFLIATKQKRYNDMDFSSLNLVSCTTLAYVGDAVFSLYVRKINCRNGFSTKELSRRCDEIVSAVNQAKIYDYIQKSLTEEELSLMRRCRNAHVNNKAKNAAMTQYKKATGLEGLLGALYLSEQTLRLNEILKLCMEASNL